MTEDQAFEKAETLCLLAVEDPEYLEAYLEAHKGATKFEHQGWRKSMGKTQHDLILKHLKKAGSITNREAMVEYSIASLTKRISELRALGHPILSTTKHHPITRQRYVRYTEAVQ